jgi:hypothetical protein
MKPQSPALWKCVRALFCGMILSAWGTGASAADPVFYAGGKAYPLIRSQTEFVVQLDEAVSEQAARAEALDRLGGVLKPIPWPVRARNVRILEVAPGTPQPLRTARDESVFRSVHPVYRFQAWGLPALANGRLVVKVAPGLSQAERDELFAEYGVDVVRPVEGLKDVYLLEPIDAGAADEVEIAAAMYQDDRTVFAHPDFRVARGPRQVAPQDPFFNLQWHLDNTGQGGGSVGADISALDAWEEALGQDVLVGLFDDAVDVNHEDLSPNYTNTSQDAFTGDQSATAANPQDPGDRHGTSVMGLILAAPNTFGVRGAAPLAQFVASRGLSELLTFEQVALVYTFARQQNVAVHNNSWGPFFPNVFPPSDIEREALDTAFREGRAGLGMVILFSAGNEATELEPGFDFSTLPSVIGVGATNARDQFASYSNYGVDIDIVAPSNDDGLPQMVTTDNTDDAGFAEPGYNDGGLDDFGDPNLADPNYTDDFGGTSAACPVAAGVAALILSVNRDLTATQVRVILEHTAEKVGDDADYDSITGRSEKYAYGRINAAEAVAAADTSTGNGGYTWPEPVSNVSVSDSRLLWTRTDDLRTAAQRGDKTLGVLVARSVGEPFGWTPTDGAVYTVGQTVAEGVTIVANADAQQYAFEESAETQYFGLFSRNLINFYSWGVLVDSDGNVTGGGSSSEVTPVVPPVNQAPRVNISVSPLSGLSPLTVSFQGNAQTDTGVVSTTWDFGDGVTDTRRTTTHTYIVPSGATDSFTATFTVEDADGDVGSRSVVIHVSSPDQPTNDNSGGGGALKILVESPGSVGSDVDTGEVPFRVQFSVDTSNVPGTLTNIQWDLGDGTTATSLSVPHTYAIAGTFPVTVQVVTQTSSGALITTKATRLITVLPSSNVNANTSANTNQNGGAVQPTARTGTSGGLCGAGMVVPLVGLMVLSLWRRRLH